MINEKSEETTSKFSQNSVSIIKNANTKDCKLVNDSSKEESKLATKKWYVIDSQQQKVNTSKAILLNLKQKSLKQVFVITQQTFVGLEDVFNTTSA